MAGTIDVALERKREHEAAQKGIAPEHAKGKEAPDTRGPRGEDEPEAEDADMRESLESAYERGRD